MLQKELDKHTALLSEVQQENGRQADKDSELQAMINKLGQVMDDGFKATVAEQNEVNKSLDRRLKHLE